MSGLDWGAAVVEQLDVHWQGQLRPRLSGLTDEEYRWEPVPNAWNVRPRADGDLTSPGSGLFTVDFAYPPPEPAPVTTIAWRLAHVIVGVLGSRNASHFGGPPVDYATFSYAGTAADALSQLDEQYARWIEGVRSLDPDALARPCGPVEGDWATATMAALALHINREVIHHGAEIALLRDLYAHSGDDA